MLIYDKGRTLHGITLQNKEMQQFCEKLNAQTAFEIWRVIPIKYKTTDKGYALYQEIKKPVKCGPC